MKVGSVAAAVLFASAGFILLCVQGAAAQTAEIRVLASNGVKAVLESVRPQAERAIGHPLAIEFNTTAALKEKIQAGEGFDVVVLTSEAVDQLIQTKKVAAGSSADISRVGIGIGLRSGAPKPDIRSAQAVKRTLLNAKSITYAEDGASRPYIEQMLDGLGIAGDVKPKTILLQGSTRTTAAVAKGEAEFVITLVSEILPVKEIELLGPLPAEFQHYVSFAAGTATQSKNPEAAKALIAFLKSPEVAAAFKAKGMEPR